MKVKATMFHSILSECKNNHGMNLVRLDLWNLFFDLFDSQQIVWQSLSTSYLAPSSLIFDISIEAPKMEKPFITKDSSILEKMICH